MQRTTLGVIRAPSRVHRVVTCLLLAHAAILYVARLSNKTAINRTVHAAHVHISFNVSWLYTPPTVMDSWYSCKAISVIIVLHYKLKWGHQSKSPNRGPDVIPSWCELECPKITSVYIYIYIICLCAPVHVVLETHELEKH